MVEHFRKGRIFLAGDAAHIHSPVGGQGMNTGIQDALNLGFKLSRVVHGSASLELLDDYEKERLPVAKKVLRSTDFFFRIGLGMGRGRNGSVGIVASTLFSFFRNHLLAPVIRSKIVQRSVVSAISEVRVAGKERAQYKVGG